MKQILQIIGAENVGEFTVKLTLIPYEMDKAKPKKASIFDIATGGAGVVDLIKQTQELQTKVSHLFIPRDIWIHEFKNRLYSTLSVDVNIDIMFESGDLNG